MFSALDWTLLAVYLLAVLAVGAVAARRQSGGEDFFLAGRSMPMWAVAISLLATMQSAATFVGGPQQAFASDLTYLTSNLAPLLAAVIVAVFFIPAFYRARVTSIYELIGIELGGPAQLAASAMFLLGRVFASGARLFIVALPFSLIVFGDVDAGSMVLSILLIAIVATIYTVLGGIRAVIWTDVLQAIVYTGCVLIALGLLWQKFPVGVGELIDALRQSDESAKLTVLDLELRSAEDLSRPYTLWATLTGLTLFMLAALGTDQDLTQRLLTCKSGRSGSWSVIIANLLAWPVVLMFLVIGLLLYVYMRRPELVGMTPPPYAVDDSRKVFLTYILQEMPTGLRGLMLAGLFAAAMSSTDSALNAMSSVTVTDFLKRSRSTRAARLAVAGWGIVLAGFACFCVYWQQASGDTLINFSLGVMVFAYSGLLAVFLTAIFTRRGNAVSAIAALLTGFITVLLLQGFAWDRWAPRLGMDFTLAFPWKMLVATTLAFLVCVAGRRTPVS